MDKISIVVPCYNVEKQIKRCIDSIKNQSYKNYEVLLIDDGSKDKTKEIIKTEIKNDKRFKYLYKKNGGVSSARNYGIEKSTGKYLCFIDSDDYVEKDYLEELYKSLIENNADISICSFLRVYENKINHNDIRKGFNNLIKHPASWNKLCKASLFKDNNLEYPLNKWYEDLELFGKVFMISNKISIVEKPLYNYIQNSSSIMHTYDDRIYQIYDIVDEIEKFGKQRKIYKKYKDNIEFINIYHILIGTIYRASFREDFTKETIIDIVRHVEEKYPNWYKNEDIKELPFFFRTYLKFLEKRRYNLIYFILNKFNRKIDL